MICIVYRYIFIIQIFTLRCTICLGSLDPFYLVKLLSKVGQDFLNNCTLQNITDVQSLKVPNEKLDDSPLNYPLCFVENNMYYMSR